MVCFLFCGNAPQDSKPDDNLIQFTLRKDALVACCQENGRARDKNRKRERTLKVTEVVNLERKKA